MAAPQGAALIPNAVWPLWARLFRLLSKKSDRGLGDTLNRLLIFVGGNHYKKWHLRKHGRPCQCNARQTRLNRRFPLPRLKPAASLPRPGRTPAG